MSTIAEALAMGWKCQQAGDLRQAEQIYRQVLRDVPRHAGAYFLLGTLYLKQGKLPEAVTSLQSSIQAQPDRAEAHSNLGVALAQQGRLQEAIASFRQALHLKPDYPDAQRNLARALKDQEQRAQREAGAGQTHYNHGVTLETQGRLDEAVLHYQQAIQHLPSFAEAHANLGAAFLQQGKLPEAVAALRQALRLNPDLALTHYNLGTALVAQDQLDQAAECFRHALRLQPQLVAAHQGLGQIYTTLGKVELAENHYQEALRLQPTPRLRVQQAILLPHVYRSLEDLNHWRQRLTENLRGLVQERVTVDLNSEPAPNLFLLAYQGLADREVLSSLAQLYQAPSEAKGRGEGAGSGTASKIHVAFFSRCFWDHTIGHLMRGIIAHLSREQFLVTVLSVGGKQDAVAHFIKEHSDCYLDVPLHLPSARRMLADLRPDVLFYPDIGMDPFTFTLAFSRLAPVQCTTWGHPSTTGIPTMDYFLSSELFETAAADAHYTETLVRLKTLPAFCYRPSVPSPPKQRSDLGLPEKNHLYACPQSLFKLHPDFDHLLGAILRRDPRGLVLLSQGLYPTWHEQLRQRLTQSIPDVADRVLFWPRLKHADFLQLNLLADVLLDPIHFNGGNTSYQGLALGTPIVTMPTALLKGRMTLGMYLKMGVLDCVAATPEEYVHLAVGLGTDPDFRHQVRTAILEANSVLYEDLELVRELEQFFQLAVARAGRPSGVS